MAIDDSLLSVNGSDALDSGGEPRRARGKQNWSYYALGITTLVIVLLVFLLCYFYSGGQTSNTFPLAALPQFSEGLVFIGHTSCDTDSLAGAIAAAYLYHGEAATCMEELNPETAYVLKHFGVERPPRSNDPKWAGKKWGLIDFSIHSQVSDGIDLSQVEIIVDHHVVAPEVIASPGPPTYADFRPWGSASTIVTYKYFEAGVQIPNATVAGLLLSAIISDTLNLKSPTTTDFDHVAMGYLESVAGMTKADRDLHAYNMFDAKSNVDGLTVSDIIQLDYKQFDYKMKNGTIKVGWGSGDTVRPEDYLAKKEEYLQTMRDIKLVLGLDLLFFAPVDVITLKSMLFLCDAREERVANAIYGMKMTEPSVMNTGDFVSRKKNFLPPLVRYLATIPTKNDL